MMAPILMLPAVFCLRGQVSVQVAVATFAEVEMLIFRNDGADFLFKGPPKPPPELARPGPPVAFQVPLSAALRAKAALQALLTSTSLNHCVLRCKLPSGLQNASVATISRAP